MLDRTVASIVEEETHFSDSLSPDSPSSRESANQYSKAVTMADEHDQRTTFEDYSSGSVLQFFTSIACPEVQAHNITNPSMNIFSWIGSKNPWVGVLLSKSLNLSNASLKDSSGNR